MVELIGYKICNQYFEDPVDLGGIKLVQAGRYYCNPGTIVADHVHDGYYELTVVNGGSATVLTNDKYIPVKKNDIFVGFPGDKWFTRLANAFEKAFANVSFEDGKTGVLVNHTPDMRQFNAAQIQKSEFDIFFFENEHYYKYIDVLEDLTDIVNSKASADDTLTVLEKLDSQQINYYGAKKDNATHYYALPSYFGNYGIIYNKDLFDKKGYYLAADKSNGAIIGSNKNAKKTNGPDGVEGTPDDGLPTTYEEFFTLCDEIFNANDTPVCWPGEYRQHPRNRK